MAHLRAGSGPEWGDLRRRGLWGDGTGPTATGSEKKPDLLRNTTGSPGRQDRPTYDGVGKKTRSDEEPTFRANGKRRGSNGRGSDGGMHEENNGGQILGALLAILNRAPNNKTLGMLQGFATGLMLSMSFFDLAYDAVNAIGFLKGNLWFFAGALLFSTIAEVFPEPDCNLADENDKQTGNSIAGKELMMRHRRRVIFSVIVTAIVAGVSLQNFPVGTAAFLGTTKGFRVGLNLALAIALHYIPEGISVALPAYFATCSKWQAFKLATLSGFAEPLGVIIVAYLFPSNLNPEILKGLLGLVGGVMAFLTLYEMLPLAFEYAGRKDAVKAVFVGMAFMSMSLYFLDISLPKEMSA